MMFSKLLICVGLLFAVSNGQTDLSDTYEYDCNYYYNFPIGLCDRSTSTSQMYYCNSTDQINRVYYGSSVDCTGSKTESVYADSTYDGSWFRCNAETDCDYAEEQRYEAETYDSTTEACTAVDDTVYITNSYEFINACEEITTDTLWRSWTCTSDASGTVSYQDYTDATCETSSGELIEYDSGDSSSYSSYCYEWVCSSSSDANIQSIIAAFALSIVAAALA